MALLSINGVPMPDPATYIVTIQDITKAERNARGSMIKELIATKDKIELSWIYLSPTELSTLLTAVGANFFEVTYLNPKTNSSRTATFYAGDRTAPALDFINGVMRYKDVKMNFIEK
ncbi:hypothetical protein KP806_07555 [Paenibacillus sp. N4]|uniref:DUF6711 family protein n=1 Tax=Paenibacillus vietnamensis TaxID=2590547 RepID=UPI001CD0BB8A|nr:DUF6711 family protein [Paenibacillus vietnamensis]MCA0754902.1 hypothetical protein [Paenibacillus vietnamensis]